MLDLRRLFDKYRIEWRDRGKNTSKGNVNICCPLCNKTSNPDFGFHLGILERSGQWHCFRNPRHSGRSVVTIFRMLNIPHQEYKDLEFHEVERSEKKIDKDFSLFRYFYPAEESQEAVTYLTNDRLFLDAVGACKKFRLKVDKEGEWAGRIIIPLTIGWTGRSMRSHIEPRYKTESTEDGFFLYRQESKSVFLVEGAFDAMRLATVSSQVDVIGKCGNRLSPALLAYLREANYLSIYNIPDNDIPFDQYFEETRILRSYCTMANVKRLNMPGQKDFGAMTESATREWLVCSH